MTKIVAIIPARGGSKRIPRKNIIDFCGKPMIAWTIEAAKQSKLFEDIIVSTDCQEIANVAIKYGALVPVLRKSASDDISPVSEATIHTLNELENLGLKYDVVIQLFAVCPLRNSNDIIEAYNFFVKKNAEFLISCFKYVGMNPWWAVEIEDGFKPKKIFNDTLNKRSQDLPTLFCPTGAVWIANIQNLKKENTFYGKNHIFWEMNWKRALDIDSQDDIELGKKLFLI